MNTKFSYRVSAIVLALLMFSTSVGFSIDFHFCGKEVKSFSLFGEAEACEMMQARQDKKIRHSCCEGIKKEIKSCPNHETSKDNCCHNETLILDIEGDFESSVTSIEQVQKVQFPTIIFIPNVKLFDITSAELNYIHYIPPLLVKDNSILYQVFRL